MQKILFIPLLLGTAFPALAAPAPSASTFTPAKPVLEKVNAGELRLDGKVTATLGAGVWELAAFSWTSPRGVITNFDEVKTKAFRLAPSALIHPIGSTDKVTHKDVKLEHRIAVIGKNRPDGTLLAREVILIENYDGTETVGTDEINLASSLLLEQGRVAQEAGQFQKALDLARKAIELSVNEEDILGEANATQQLAISYVGLKQNQKAIESYKRALVLAEQSKSLLTQVLCLREQAEVHQAMGQDELAISVLERAVALSATTPMTVRINVLDDLADAYRDAKKRPQAVSALSRLFQLQEGAAQYDEATSTLFMLARAQAFLNMASAKESIEKGRKRMSNIKDEGFRPLLILRFANALRVTGDVEGALAHYEASAKLYEAGGETETVASIRAAANKLKLRK